MDWKWFWPTLNVGLNINANLYKFLDSQRQKMGDSERGGQLFMKDDPFKGLVLMIATPPHKKDKSSKTWLELNPTRCREEIIKYNKFDYQFVGYWHTHPELIPQISTQDIVSLNKFSKQNMLILKNPLAIIVGQDKGLNGIKIWSMQDYGPLEAEIIIKSELSINKN